MTTSASAPSLQLGPGGSDANAPPGSAGAAGSVASDLRLATIKNRGEGIGRDTAVSEGSPPSRTVKMYRNAAREYGKGCSAGQAMWK